MTARLDSDGNFGAQGGPSASVRPATIEPAGQADFFTRRRLLFILPAIGFAGLAAELAGGLGRDPIEVPSTLIGKPVPLFSLPPVQGRRLGLSSVDLYGEVSLVNAFASWCYACRAEHPLLMGLSADKAMPIHGLNYKDAPADAERWLDSFGDPYTRTGADRDGRVSIDWGVYGVPETYVVGADGRIAHKHVGALSEQDTQKTILPLVGRLRAVASRRAT
jgi:cytochrome c biogenesis protein CcmG/thiol:disulfide interchange protein DsbE